MITDDSALIEDILQILTELDSNFINKKFDGIIKEAKVDPEIIKMTEDLYKKAGNLIEQAELKAAIEEIFDYIGFANKYYDEKEPWKQCKENMEEFNNTTYTCTYIIANISNLIAPFMPNTSKKIKKKRSDKNIGPFFKSAYKNII